jgi:hypothetical protein
MLCIHVPVCLTLVLLNLYDFTLYRWLYAIKSSREIILLHVQLGSSVSETVSISIITGYSFCCSSVWPMEPFDAEMFEIFLHSTGRTPRMGDPVAAQDTTRISWNKSLPKAEFIVLVFKWPESFTRYISRPLNRLFLTFLGIDGKNRCCSYPPICASVWTQAEELDVPFTMSVGP